jgi:aldose 1-epimerase
MLPTGRQLEITSGTARAVVTEVGAGLRAFESNGRPYVETWPEDRRPPRGAGTILVPWPNRTAGGKWTWQDQTQQLALSEPATGNAIHGLLRHTLYTEIQHTADVLTLRAVVPVQPGWPVPLDHEIGYHVGADGLTVTHTVRNLGLHTVPFGIGAHPYLRAGDSATDESTLTLSASTALPLDGGLPTGPTEPVSGDMDFRSGQLLGGRNLDHAFGGCEPTDGLVRHRLSGPGGSVEMWADPAFGWVQVFTPDDHPDRGRAVAVEPMTCPPDALNSGTDLIELAAGDSWTGRWGIRPLA